ncbi:MAG: hypothetical protein A2176_00995 [Spirochaetes bacterium RBG_13_51_14]|nr:MAG: hypothetical protein A2176_00995 [Spirochaetes bacterium RBG_13_51_14]
MLKRNGIVIAVLMLCVAVFSSGIQSAERYQWKLEKTKDGCQMYTTTVPGKEYIASKCVCVIPAKMEVIGVILRDIPNFPEWMNDCKATKLLKTVDDVNDVFIFWFRQHVPLLTDRDMVLKSSVVQNYNKGWSRITANLTKEMNYDVNKGYVRMPFFTSEWLLEWIDREHTRATFMIDPDLGKGLPVGMSNGIIKDTPYKTMMNLMKMVKLQKYIDSASKSKYRTMVENGIKAGNLKDKK